MNNILDKWINDHEAALIEIAQDIFNHPEVAYKETNSSARLGGFMAAHGFKLTWDIAGLPTAFSATWGTEGPHIGFLAEYDALPGLGHACGHNLLGTGVCGAACALRQYLIDTNQKARITVFGTPAEEIMSGKIVMNNAGVFDNLDIAVMWHPFDRNRVSNDVWMSSDVKNYTFRGIDAHAAMAPTEGRSALDAAELMNVGVNYLREHVASDVRMHYAYVDNGIPSNVVPGYAKTNYFIRSGKRSRTDDASERVDNCARGAALMTGTTVEIELVKTCREMKVNRVLTELYYDAMKEVPLPEYTEEELKLAEEISNEAGFDNNGEYFGGLEPLEDEPVIIFIGTDATEVSHKVPLITLSAATMCKGTPIHHWTTAKQSGCSIGHKGMMYAVKSMAEGTRLLLETPGAIERAWEYHRNND
ncbi:MAG: amidohydrolase [Clostridiales bacterium]|nr:amidohydrolase [Candidatus Crickella merdequi]